MERKTIKNCPECGAPIKGRTDKKFCSDLCRNSFNNIQQGYTNRKLNTTNNILKKNRQILERLVQQRIRKTTKERLLQQGFNFYYVTSFEHGKDGIYFCFCYEYGYYLLENNYYKLVKRRKNETLGNFR